MRETAQESLYPALELFTPCMRFISTEDVWGYKEMTISVHIDSCAWNYLSDHDVDLAVELPTDRFALFITREVEIEIAAIPDTGKDGSDKRPLKVYIEKSITQNAVKTTSVFGFAAVEPDGSLSPLQTCGGFDQGSWQSEADRQWYASSDVKRMYDINPVLENGVQRRSRPSGLAKNQADAAIAVRAFQSVVLTNEHLSKMGPIKLAVEKNGTVAYLTEFQASGLSLADFVTRIAPR